MINYKFCDPDYSFIMAPFYYMDNDELLKSQLINLSYQVDKKFEVVIPDPHYSKRNWIDDFVKQLDYNVVHFPYIPNLKTPKSFDYCIFNNAVLMSSSNKIITFQDWRFCHPKLIKILRQLNNFDFVGFEWQVLYKDNCAGVEWDGKRTTHHKKSTIPISIGEAESMYINGKFPEISWNSSRVDTFHNSCWGHYCISKNLWMQVNGIDEVATNTRHYADLDLNTRMQALYLKSSKKIEIPMIKNVMARMMHDKGQYFAGSNVELEFKIMEAHKKCCFTNTSSMNDKQFVEYVVNNINNGKFTKLYSVPYSDEYLKNNKNESLDKDHSTIGFQCNNCSVIGETPHWYEKSPLARIVSLVGIGKGKQKLGRRLDVINRYIENETFDNKINTLNNSWYDEKFIT